MKVDLQAGIVRILNQDGTTAGTGFLVTGDGLMATCAHVVEAAGASPGDALRIVFHAIGEEHAATVEPAYWRASTAEDVAILRLEGSLPEGIAPLPLGGSTRAKIGDVLSTFGFPDAKPVEGMTGKCEVVGRTRESGFPVLQLRSQEVTPGFSGAPVQDSDTGHVVGLVTSIAVRDRHGRLTETAFITPTETLREVCPILPVPLRELLRRVNVKSLITLDRRAWGHLWLWFRKAVSTRPVWSALGSLAAVGVVAGAVWGVQAYQNRGWRAISGGHALLGQADFFCSRPVEPFEIQVTEVTNADYLKCVRAGVCAAPEDLWESRAGGWTFPQGFDRHPVWSLTWEDADTYCRFIGARLPSEAEWVQAARDGSSRDYPWQGEFGVTMANVYESGVGNTVAVTTYPQGRSETGLYHLIGNVREWVSDRAIDPCDATAGERGFVAKGGSFMDSSENTTLWYRAQGDGLPLVGVRCVRD